MSRKYAIFFLCTLTALFSCSRKGEDSFYESGKGGIRLTLDTDYASATKADVEEGSIGPDSFKIEIINSKGIIFKRWATYADYKSEENTAFVMNAGGPYTLRATYGDSLASGFDAFFFMGEQEFTVLPQETVDLNVVCRMANVKVAVVYGENIAKDYSDYKVTVKNSRGSLDFTKDCTEAGYLPVGNLTVTLELTDNEGKKWYFKNGSEVSAAAGDFITLNLDTKEIPEMEVEVTITIDKTTEDHTVTVNLPSYMLPADAPSFNPVGFGQEDKTVTFVEGTSPENAAVNINAASGIKSCVMKVNSAYLTSSLGWPSEIDFLNLTPDVINILSRDGVVYTENMDGVTLANIEMKGLAKVFRYTDDVEANRHSFTVSVTDAMGKSAEATYVMAPVAAQKSVNDIPEADVWAVKAYVTMTTDGNPENLFPEISTDGTSWTKPSYDQVSVEGNSRRVLIKGLTPGTAYSVRAGYNSYSSGEFKAMTTETAQQVENAGFEEWYETVVEEKIPIYFPYLQDAQDKWWDSNNRQTAAEEHSTYNSYKCFPTTWYVDGREGGKAASIMAVAVNSWNSEIMGAGKTPGELFIGTYGGERGHVFGSRPSKLRFYYKYEPNGTDTWQATVQIKNGSEVIAENVVTSSESVNDWRELTLDLNYSDNMKKATGIYIQFLQSTSDSPNTSKREVTTPAGSFKIYGGSVLTVDDIELIYE